MGKYLMVDYVLCYSAHPTDQLLQISGLQCGIVCNNAALFLHKSCAPLIYPDRTQSSVISNGEVCLKKDTNYH